MNLPPSLLVMVTEALSGQPHGPITNPDGGGNMDFVHVTILRTFGSESFTTNFALNLFCVSLHVALKQLWRLETFATLLAGRGLAVYFFDVSIKHKLVRG